MTIRILKPFFLLLILGMGRCNVNIKKKDHNNNKTYSFLGYAFFSVYTFKCHKKEDEDVENENI